MGTADEMPSGDAPLPVGGCSKAKDETLTEELLQKLLQSASPEAYLADLPSYDRTLADYLGELLRERSLRRSEVIRRSGINATFGYQIFQGTRRPGRDNALALAMALGCNLRQTQRLLRLAGLSELWCKDRRDAIVIFCIAHGFSLQRCDEELYRLGEQTLTHAE